MSYFLSKRMRLLSAAGFAAFIISAGAAGAADAIYEQSPEPPLPPQQTNLLWNGAYIGAYGGYEWLQAEISPGADMDGIDGITGGLFTGYNYQFAPDWVGGVEATAGLGAAENSFGGNKVEKNWDASLRARLGYAFENSMVYGLAGLAGTHAEVSDATGSDTNIHLGWTIGAGAETFLTDTITARVEYNYSDFGSRDYSLGAGSTNVDIDSHAIKLGVGFKF